jgi:DNA-binding HxlR family transcriptional regulator
MRSYGQYCALAKALDVIGDRWTMLIVRELLIRGSCRYTDLRDGLPGIATNLLADRLRELEQAGIVRREAAPPPIATTLFRLTVRGEELEPVLQELGHWGAPLLAEPAAEDVFRSRWLTLPLEHHLRDRTPDLPPVTLEVRTGDEPMLIETAGGRVRTRPGSVPNPDAVLTGPPHLVIATLTGKLDLTDDRAAGLQYLGDPETLRRVQPMSPAPAEQSSASRATDEEGTS